jgi:hypothetical protein
MVTEPILKVRLGIRDWGLGIGERDFPVFVVYEVHGISWENLCEVGLVTTINEIEPNILASCSAVT